LNFTGLVKSFLGLVGLNKNAESQQAQYPADFSYSSSNNNYNNHYDNKDEEGIANQILSFIGIKGIRSGKTFVNIFLLE
jgi:hypothetical protein